MRKYCGICIALKKITQIYNFKNMKTLTEIYEKYKPINNIGSDKGSRHNYIDTYEKLFLKREKINLLEIGVNTGHSLQLWADFFKDSNIVGIDITASNYKFNDNKNVNFIVSDATKPDIVNKIPNLKYDYIIDDGSHIVQDQVNSFKNLFGCLNKDGIYIIEDIPNIERDFNTYIQLKKMFNLNLSVIDTRYNDVYDDVLVIYTRK